MKMFNFVFKMDGFIHVKGSILYESTRHYTRSQFRIPWQNQAKSISNTIILAPIIMHSCIFYLFSLQIAPVVECRINVPPKSNSLSDSTTRLREKQLKHEKRAQLKMNPQRKIDNLRREVAKITNLLE